MTPEFLENGLGARLLLAYPPRRQKRWTEEDLVGEIEQRVNEVFTNLLELQPSRDSDGDPEPVDVPLSSDAKALWVAFVNESGREQAGRDGEGLIAAWSKLEGYAARFALLVHQLRHAADPKSVDPWRVDAGSVSAGIELARWFGNEAERVYAVLSESDEERALRLLCETIAAKGGTMTPRGLMRCSRRYPTAALAESASQAIVDAGLGRWVVPASNGQPGRPSDSYVLLETSDVVDRNARRRRQQRQLRQRQRGQKSRRGRRNMKSKKPTKKAATEAAAPAADGASADVPQTEAEAEA